MVDEVVVTAHVPFMQLDCCVMFVPHCSFIVCPAYWQLVIDELQYRVFVPPWHCTVHPVCPWMQQLVHMSPPIGVVVDVVDGDVVVVDVVTGGMQQPFTLHVQLMAELYLFLQS